MKPVRPGRFWLWGMLGVVSACLVVTGIFLLRQTNQGPDVQSPGLMQTTQPAAQDEVLYVSGEGRYMFHGTIVLARAVEKYAYGDYTQPFSQMSTFNPSAYDAWAADFECPITTHVVPYETQIQHLVFNCRPEWLPELTKYVQLFNLANNHTAD